VDGGVTKTMENNTQIRRNGSDASWVRQSIGLTIAVIALVGFMVPTMAAIVRPMQQQIDYLKDASTAIEKRAERMAQVVDEKIQGEIHAVKVASDMGMARLDEKLQIELEAVKEATNLEHTRSKARIEKLEEWQKWWHRSIHLGQDRNGRATAN
jgi:hypothetical protein